MATVDFASTTITTTTKSIIQFMFNVIDDTYYYLKWKGTKLWCFQVVSARQSEVASFILVTNVHNRH